MAAQDLPPPRIEDLYLTDTVTEPITLTDGRTAIDVRSRGRRAFAHGPPVAVAGR